MDADAIAEGLAHWGYPLFAPAPQGKQKLKVKLNINLEIAEPGDFIPLPAGRERRLNFVDRFGATDVFLDDPYAIAISKLHRGRTKDLRDVRLLLDGGLVTAGELESKIHEVANARAPAALNINEERMRTGLAAALQGDFSAGA